MTSESLVKAREWWEKKNGLSLPQIRLVQQFDQDPSQLGELLEENGKPVILVREGLTAEELLDTLFHEFDHFWVERVYSKGGERVASTGLAWENAVSGMAKT